MAAQVPPHTPNHLHHLHQYPRPQIDLRIPAIEKYAHCLCLHVKPTTIFIAIFKLIRALLFASILLNSEFAINEQGGHDINLSSLDDRHKSTAAAMAILTRIIMASVSAVGIYAVVSGRAALLMPLYAMLLIDFFFSLPAFYSRDLDSSFEDGFSNQQRGQHMATHPQYTRYSTILFSTIAMIVKIYFLCVVWKCYRYLRLIELVRPIRLDGIYPHLPPARSQYPIVRVLGSIDSTDLSSGHNVTPPPYESVASGMKPPNYEEAIKSSNNAVFTVNTYDGPNFQHLQQSSQAPPGAQQTVVFNIPNSEQTQNISTQVLGTSIPTINNARMGSVTGPSQADTNQNVSQAEPSTNINMSGSTGVPGHESLAVDNEEAPVTPAAPAPTAPAPPPVTPAGASATTGLSLTSGSNKTNLHK